MWLSCREEVEALTKQLVNVESIVNTPGEARMAEVIEDWLRQLPYFQLRPNQVMRIKTRQDLQNRYNVIAYVEGTAGDSNKTVILLGHHDTVGIDDYGKQKSLACSPDDLLPALLEGELPNSLRDQLESGEWMVGRGTVDMKSGVASHLALLRHFSEHPDQLNGNLLVLSECDEEDGSNGILSAVHDLLRLREEKKWDYAAAINADFVAPRYAGDQNRYLYVGSVGKLLPSFFVTGAETHVGSCFEGLDPNYLVAELTSQINYNTELCDEADGEIPMPPVSLKQTDFKPTYTVQTALSAFVYYNFFVHRWTPAEVLSRLKEQATTAFDRALTRFNDQYRLYCERTGEPYQQHDWQPRVYTYEEFYKEMKQIHGTSFESHMQRVIDQLKDDTALDIRMFSARIVEEAWSFSPDRSPAMIVFYSSLYSPRVEVDGKTDEEARLLEAVKTAVEQVQPHYPHPIVSRKYFPYISDMSFLTLSDDESGIEAYCNNMPAWENRLQVPFDDIRRLNVPVVNIGPYGADAHKKMERLERSFSFEMVPNLTCQVIQALLK